MVPGVRHESGGVNPVCGPFGVPEHALLDQDRDNGGNQGQQARHRQGGAVGGKELVQASVANPDAGAGQHHREQDGGHRLHPFVAVPVVAVRLPTGDANPDHDDEGREHVGTGVDGVGHHGAGVGDQAGGQLKDGKNQVDVNGAAGDPHSELAAVGLNMGISHRE